MGLATSATDSLASVGFDPQLVRSWLRDVFARELPDNAEEREEALARVERLADLLDSRFSVMGIRFGWDAVVGLLPVVGDTAAAAASASILAAGYRLGASRRTLARMARNLAIDAAVGSIPVAGAVFDVFFKANKRNLKLLRREFSS